jgi:hypothetical protein
MDWGVLRGGSWLATLENSKGQMRTLKTMRATSNYTGFRVVCAPSEE